MSDCNSPTAGLELQLTLGALKLVEIVSSRLSGEAAHTPGVFQWLVTVLDRHLAMAESLAQNLVGAELKPYLLHKIAVADIGELLPVDLLVSLAAEHARSQQREKANERDIAAIVLEKAGYTLAADGSAGGPAPNAQLADDTSPDKSGRGKGVPVSTTVTSA